MPRKFELLHDISSEGNFFQGSAWALFGFDGGNPVFDKLEQGLAPSVDSFDKASVYLVSSSSVADVRQSIFPGSMAGKTITIGAWFRVPVLTGSGSIQLIMAFKDFLGQFDFKQSLTSISSHQLLRLSHTFSTGFTDSGFGLLLRVTEGNSGDTMSVWRGHAFFDEEFVDVGPQYDFQRLDHKIEDIDISHDGGLRRVFRWGNQWRNKFGVRLINSADHAAVNTWWRSNAELMWFVDCGLEVHSVYVANRDIPINSFILPQSSLYQGVIELETY